MSSEHGTTETGVNDVDGDDEDDVGEGGGAAAGDSDGYVHRPNDWEDGEATGPSVVETSDDAGEPPGQVGWTLVAVVVLAFLVVPGVIYLRPATPGEMGFGFLTAMLVLPMVPAALLGATAVWSMRAGED